MFCLGAVEGELNMVYVFYHRVLITTLGYCGVLIIVTLLSIPFANGIMYQYTIIGAVAAYL